MQTSYTIERLKSLSEVWFDPFHCNLVPSPVSFSQHDTMTWIYPPSNNGKWRPFLLKFPILNNITSSWRCRLLHPGSGLPKKNDIFSIQKSLPGFPTSVVRYAGLKGASPFLAPLASRSFLHSSVEGCPVWDPMMLEIQFYGYLWIHHPCGDLLCLGWWFILWYE